MSLVQGWVRNPADDFGIVLDSPDNLDGLGVDSREAATAAGRPQLAAARPSRATSPRPSASPSRRA